MRARESLVCETNEDEIVINLAGVRRSENLQGWK